MIDVNDVELRSGLELDEGVKGRAYDDVTGRDILRGSSVIGNPSIGIGHNLQVSGLCPAAITAQYRFDVDAVLSALGRRLPWFGNLNDDQQRVIVNLCFNLGIDGLLGFPKFLAAMERGDFATARAELINSNAAKQEPGRIARLAQILYQPGNVA